MCCQVVRPSPAPTNTISQTGRRPRSSMPPVTPRRVASVTTRVEVLPSGAPFSRGRGRRVGDEGPKRSRSSMRPSVRGGSLQQPPEWMCCQVVRPSPAPTNTISQTGRRPRSSMPPVTPRRVASVTTRVDVLPSGAPFSRGRGRRAGDEGPKRSRSPMRPSVRGGSPQSPPEWMCCQVVRPSPVVAGEGPGMRGPKRSRSSMPPVTPRRVASVTTREDVLSGGAPFSPWSREKGRG